MCQAIASALGGYLGHHYDRRKVIAAGCFIWCTMTILFSFSTVWYWGAFLWAWNGIGLAFVIPNTQSLVADYYNETDRGKAFGTLYTTGALQTKLCSVSHMLQTSDKVKGSLFLFQPCTGLGTKHSGCNTITVHAVCPPTAGATPCSACCLPTRLEVCIWNHPLQICWG